MLLKLHLLANLSCELFRALVYGLDGKVGGESESGRGKGDRG